MFLTQLLCIVPLKSGLDPDLCLTPPGLDLICSFSCTAQDIMLQSTYSAVV